MEALKIACNVTPAAAIRARTGTAGPITVALSPEVLDALTDDERDVLASSLTPQLGSGANSHTPTGAMVLKPTGSTYGASLTLPGADTSPETVAQALSAWIVEELKRRESARADEHVRLTRMVNRVMSAAIVEGSTSTVPWERWRIMVGGSPLGDVSADLDAAEAVGIEGASAARIRRMALLEEVQTLMAESTRQAAQEFAARPVSDRVYRNGKVGWDVRRPVSDSSIGTRWQSERDADTHYTAACPEYALRLAEAAAECKRLNTVQESEKAAAERAAEERAAVVAGAFCAYALAHPELHDAAEEGYEIDGGVADAVTDDVAACLRPLVGVVEVVTDRVGSKTWKVWECGDRKAPKPPAIKTQKAAVAAVADVKRPDGCTVEVAKVQRVTTTTDDGYEKTSTHRTAIVVWVSCERPGVSQRAVIAFLE